ncbi:UDP-N-acetylmuramoyl-tripeptide--D-alanyl-D-alanine ligase [Marinicella rhabdoformis]|uniref:UDP-N-acetylmuramoyl-tripeptide--D-alanyl-D- alanine ligase n=1 Tax=Marinicella rhabdoformis TaxID=2580566 RepID=UPI0012AEBB99|nr:UDP-N-acetylmuramoyl-tripeptide--D-alanyl-D-alanine ligase [Marinicella rhabdoformis]
MIKMNLHQICAVVGGSMVGKEVRIHGVSTDSRTVEKGQLFVALKGEHFNGESFCQQAVARGAAAVMVSDAVEVDVPQLICENTLEALEALAKAWLRQCDVRVVAVTGSNGKTTVKNMLHAILSQSHRCFATPGNWNNEIGVPLSLLQLSPEDDFAVIEMGAAQIGDIAHLTELVKPDVALVNNVSNAHVGRFGSIENIAIGKGEIYEALADNGVAIINGDDVFKKMWQMSVSSQQLTFGGSESSDVRLLEATGTTQIMLPGEHVITIDLPVLGRHNQMNAAAAVAVAVSLAIEEHDMVAGLASFIPEKGRMECAGSINNTLIIDDSYNANLASAKAAIDVLQVMKSPSVLVMGDMAELGEFAVQMHEEIGLYADTKGIDTVLAVGKYAGAVCSQRKTKCEAFNDVDAVIEALKSEYLVGGTVLVKGSRSMQLERVVDALVQQEVRL